ncbi:hypothetical protein IFM89_036372 [Coptis chinensis]|uniref:Cyclin-dependent protein kinase inhibitor SMR1 n=1 Tax=Coptis chinensis TaxID=261450 RepID=A0A835LKL6_9MAGN|nr:hypothetical protein IFM89_036372 [Coptis chinensis]
MSIDHQVRPALPPIRLRTINVQTRHTDEDGEVIQLSVDDDECRTPTSSEYKIPMILSCPPAPRKRRKVVLCKRKLSEIQFFEVVGRDEVESFFKSSFEFSHNIRKRPCPNT